MFCVASINIIEYSYIYFNNALRSDVVIDKTSKLLQISTMRWLVGAVALGLIFSPVRLLGQSSDGRPLPGKHQAEKIFAVRCAICHGADARGGQYGPRLTGNDDLQGKPVSFFRNIIRNGIPSAGMPAFDLPDSELDAMARFIQSLNVSAKGKTVAGDRLTGEKYFFGEGKCASCHMVYGRGSATGPDLSNVAGEMTVAEIRAALLDPTDHISPGYEFVTVKLQNGETLRGFVRSRSNFEIALQDLEGQFHLLSTSEISDITSDKKSPMPPINASSEELQNLVAYLNDLNGVKPGNTLSTEDSGSSGVSFSEILESPSKNWLTYNGNISSNRYSPLSEINKGNVSELQLKWLYTVPLWRQFYPDTSYFRENLQYFGLETTPLVVDGILYATGPQQAYALDARTGQVIWVYSRLRTPGIVGDAALATSRGPAILGDKLFMVTDDAHMIALNRITGKLVWESVMPDKPMQYGGTVAPLVVKDMVIGGIAGADWGVRGFLAAYRVSDGKLLWRHWTIPRKGDPEAKTWGGNPPETGGGSTWITGSYDPETDTIFWTTGNPHPDGDASGRPGDNLYTNSILALNADDGKLKWYYQVTPADIHDWDATGPVVLVNAVYQGKQRKLLLHADKNGFFYVLDRANGKVLTAKPFVKVNWASGIGPDGRPQRLPEGGIVCPAAGTNWNGTAFSPVTHLYYVMATEQCDVDLSAINAKEKPPEEESARKYLEAVDLDGKVVWKVPEIGPADGKRDAGILATSGGLLFYGDPSGAVVAADASTGKTLWHFITNGENKASPITYTVGGKQFIALAVGPNILAFSLP